MVSTDVPQAELGKQQRQHAAPTQHARPQTPKRTDSGNKALRRINSAEDAALEIQAHYRGLKTRRALSAGLTLTAGRWKELANLAVQEGSFKLGDKRRSSATGELSSASGSGEQSETGVEEQGSEPGSRAESAAAAAVPAAAAAVEQHQAARREGWQSPVMRRTAFNLWQRVRRHLLPIVQKRGLQLKQEHWLEVVDRKHRYGSHLRVYYEYWLSREKTEQSFFQWLEHSREDLPECPRQVLEKTRVHYCSAQEVLQYEVVVNPQGLLQYMQSGRLVDTADAAPGTIPGVPGYNPWELRKSSSSSSQPPVLPAVPEEGEHAEVRCDAARHVQAQQQQQEAGPMPLQEAAGVRGQPPLGGPARVWGTDTGGGMGGAAPAEAEGTPGPGSGSAGGSVGVSRTGASNGVVAIAWPGGAKASVQGDIPFVRAEVRRPPPQQQPRECDQQQQLRQVPQDRDGNHQQQQQQQKRGGEQQQQQRQVLQDRDGDHQQQQQQTRDEQQQQREELQGHQGPLDMGGGQQQQQQQTRDEQQQQQREEHQGHQGPLDMGGGQQQQQQQETRDEQQQRQYDRTASGGRAGPSSDPGEANAGARQDPGTKAPKPKDSHIYVMDTSRRLFVARKVRGTFHHTSFLRGSPLIAAGGIRVHQGALQRITAMSGHYKPTMDDIDALVRTLVSLGVDMRPVAVVRQIKSHTKGPKTSYHKPEHGHGKQQQQQQKQAEPTGSTANEASGATGNVWDAGTATVQEGIRHPGDGQDTAFAAAMPSVPAVAAAAAAAAAGEWGWGFGAAAGWQTGAGGRAGTAWRRGARRTALAAGSACGRWHQATAEQAGCKVGLGCGQWRSSGQLWRFQYSCHRTCSCRCLPGDCLGFSFSAMSGVSCLAIGFTVE